MKASTIKLFRKLSLVALISALSITVGQAQTRKYSPNKTVKVKTTNKRTYNNSSKKAVVNKKSVRNNSYNRNRKVTSYKNNSRATNKRFTKLPSKARFVTHNKVKYAHYNGVFYKPYGNSYITVNRPTGLRISVVL